MIAVRLMGGLGNQMFQYALGRNLALSHNKKLILDLSHLINQPSSEVPRQYELGLLKIKARMSNGPVEVDPPKPLFGKPKEFNVVVEKGFPFKSEILEVPDNTLLEGYWQCEKYFKRHEKQIRKDFKLKMPISQAKKRIAKQIFQTDGSVSLHVRRGDYVTHKASSQFHGLPGIEYYKKAVSVITKDLNSPTFFVLSDDPQWCKDNLKLGFPTVIVDYIPQTGHEDMMLMSYCDHHIIANSSFSWWGAWLDPKPNKIVVAPKTWFREKSADASDIVPTSWIRM